MKTLVIKMEDLAAGTTAYPVQLFFDDGRPDWLTQPLATIKIPQDLSVLNPPLDPQNGKPLDGQQIRDAFLKEGSVSARFVAWGRYLHQLLFQGELVAEWTMLHNLYPKEDAPKTEGLRTILDIKPDTLRWLPWELIFQDPLPWFFNAANPFSRGTLEKKLPIRSFTWPIRALIVVGSREDDKKIKADQEVEAIQYAFIKSPVPIDWHVVCRPTKAELTDLITKFKPHIFHFIGHGKEITDYLFLELSDSKGGPAAEEWTVADVSIDLLNWQPRFAFINACRSSSAVDQKNSWDIGRAFANAGVPAVVGMQADIQGEAAAEFSRKLYESMMRGLAIDRSLAEARAAVKNLPNITLKRRDWALATLYLQQLPEQILDMKPQIDNPTRDKFKLDGKLKEVHDFVGRRAQRRKLWHGVDEIEDYKDEFRGACIVVGNEQMGKTALVQASIKVCALRNRRISYIDVDRSYQSTKNLVEILKLIREGDPKSSDLICAPLMTAPFAEFDKKYGALLDQPGADTILAGDNHLCEQVFNLYKAALVEVAEDNPLIIVLDHLSVEWEQFNSVLVPKLLLPIAQNQLENCRLILVCTATEYEKRLPKALKDAASVIDVAAWPRDKYVPLARQICLYNDIKLDEDVEVIIERRANRLKSDWGPTRLRKMVDMLLGDDT